MTMPIRRHLLAVAALCIPMTVAADNSTSVDGYTIHHNAITTDFLAPQVANAYGVQRSKNRGLLTVSILQDAPGTMGKPVTGKVEGGILLTTGQTSPIPMREVKEQDAIYYLGVFPVQNGQRVNFVLKVTPDGSGKDFMLKMDQLFFTE